MEQRFWAKVDRSAGPGGCWPWTSTTAGSTARYGTFRVGTKSTDPKVPAHRIAYALAVGPIPDGLEIDHVAARGCVTKLCCNPAHLEPVTHAENRRRARLTVCRSGRHDLTDPTNQNFDRNGNRRGCLPCKRETSLAHYHANREVA